MRAVSTTSEILLTTVTVMGRPRIYDEPRIATAIRLPASLRDELDTVATQREVSVNYLVIRAVSDYLRRLPPPDTLERVPRRPASSAAKVAT